jgi:hypothetical protein
LYNAQAAIITQDYKTAIKKQKKIAQMFVNEGDKNIDEEKLKTYSGLILNNIGCIYGTIEDFE